MATNYKHLTNAIVETPRGSQNKFDYDPKQGVFVLNKTLPMGTVFPFDFGFIPGTPGEDGDLLDILVIMEEPAYPGCLVRIRLLGVLKATQQEKKGKNKGVDFYNESYPYRLLILNLLERRSPAAKTGTPVFRLTCREW
jgi:inorganic pyrophosphatase